MYTSEDLNGVIYDSEAQMARAHGVLPTTFNQRKLSGLPLSLCLKPYVHPPKKEKPSFKYGETIYHSLHDCCKNLEISYKAVYYYVSKYNLSPEEAINKILNKNKSA